MRLMRLVPIYQEPKTSKKHPENKIYPYLLKGLAITRPNQVWCTDISTIPMRRGFLYLVAIMDWHSRKVLCWRLSKSMDASFCVEALKDALAKYGPPEICNSDQGSQFTSTELTEVLLDAKVKISMDGRGCWIDNRMIERLWQLRTHLADFMAAYNVARRLKTLGGLTPYEYICKIWTAEPDRFILRGHFKTTLSALESR